MLSWALVFLLGSLAYDALERLGLLTMGYREMFLHSGVAGAWIGGYVAWRRRAIFRNHANSALFAISLVTFFLVQCFWGAAYALELPFRTALCLTSMFYVLASGAVTTLLSPRFAMSPAAAALGALGAALWPDLAWLLIGVSASVALAVVGLSWPTVPRTSAPAGGDAR